MCLSNRSQIKEQASEKTGGALPCELCVRLCLGLSLSELWWPHLEKQVVELTPESAVKMTRDDPENVLEK